MCVFVYVCVRVCVLATGLITNDVLEKSGAKLRYKNLHILCDPVIEISASLLPDSVGASILTQLRKGTDLVPEVLFSFFGYEENN
jgi:hypothetical protein